MARAALSCANGDVIKFENGTWECTAENKGPCAGQSPTTAWQQLTGNTLTIVVDTSACGFTETPIYTTSLGGNTEHFSALGTTSIYEATATSFRVFVRLADARPLTPSQVTQWGWHMNYIATPKNP
jgi:hypothetical protein